MKTDKSEHQVRRRKSLVRWLLAGIIFMGVNTLVLYALVQGLGASVMLGTLVSAEICTLLRFILNERWVFGHVTHSWRRLWQYHVANAGAFVVWWLGTNALTRIGMNYLVASVLAVALSTGFSFASNFHWVWKSKEHPIQ